MVNMYTRKCGRREQKTTTKKNPSNSNTLERLLFSYELEDHIHKSFHMTILKTTITHTHILQFDESKYPLPDDYIDLMMMILH